MDRADAATSIWQDAAGKRQRQRARVVRGALRGGRPARNAGVALPIVDGEKGFSRVRSIGSNRGEERDEPSANRMGAPEEAAEIGGRRASQRPYLSTRASTRLALVVPCTPHRSHQFESKSVVTHTFNFTLPTHNRISRCELRSPRPQPAARMPISIWGSWSIEYR